MGHANVPPCQSSLTQLTQEDEIHPTLARYLANVDAVSELSYNWGPGGYGH
jgi:hypothetical protein